MNITKWFTVTKFPLNLNVFELFQSNIFMKIIHMTLISFIINVLIEKGLGESTIVQVEEIGAKS